MKYIVKTSMVLIGVICSVMVQANDLVPIKMLDGKVTISTPEDFTPMPQELVEIKYPSSRRPTDVLTDETTQVTLAFNHTNNKMSKKELIKAHKGMSKMFHNLYPSAEWMRDEVIKQNGHPFIVFELVTPALDTQIHNIIYATSVDERFLLMSFNATVEKAPDWLARGEKMMESIIIN
ncbi:hypothetical protein [Agarivorans sp. 1_MG-2023]|uniref:hypothetical protein n=1 Tax=Agarivorans sp. 1_MG-2023 TaxID=3062634 RepID=UPI0026E2652D|nr:hypothetical protein [Agarivorans sp. 1_MG-2023]MDO6762931.1 hypothetical protein [Agarivorans sp. 1_MG-2023]